MLCAWLAALSAASIASTGAVAAPDQPAARPCTIRDDVRTDPRLDPDVLRVLQTEPYFAFRRTVRPVSYVLRKELKGRSEIEEIEEKDVGCGLSLRTSRRTLAGEPDGARTETVSLHSGLKLEMIAEASPFEEVRYINAGQTKTSLRRLKSIDVNGYHDGLAAGDKYTFGYAWDWDGSSITDHFRCEVQARVPASTFHPALTGHAITRSCRRGLPVEGESRPIRLESKTILTDYDFEGLGSCRFDVRPASEFYSGLGGNALVSDCANGRRVAMLEMQPLKWWFPEQCKLQVRPAADFNRDLKGEAFSMSCFVAIAWGSTWFPELGAWLEVDPVDGVGASPVYRKWLVRAAPQQ